MLVGERGGLGAARIDHDHLAAARLQRLRLAAEVGHRPQAAVRHHRIRAEHHEQIAALDVGHRDRQPVAEHEPGRQLLRHLIERRRRVDVLRAERAAEPRARRATGPILCAAGLPITSATASRPCAREDRRQPALDLGERLVPRRLDEHAVALHQRRAQAIGILMQVAQRRALGADEARAKHVGLVAADRRRPCPSATPISRPQHASHRGQMRCAMVVISRARRRSPRAEPLRPACRSASQLPARTPHRCRPRRRACPARAPCVPRSSSGRRTSRRPS